MADSHRFNIAVQDDINQLIDNYRAANTGKQTNKWATIRKQEPDMLKMAPAELGVVLQQFYAEIRKKKGGEYEPGSLNAMITSLDRHLKENSYLCSLTKSREFASSKACLEGKARVLRESGMGTRPNRAHSLTVEEEKVLWSCGQLGTTTPRALVNSVWWLLTQHLGLRGKEFHHKFKIEHLIFCKGNSFFLNCIKTIMLSQYTLFL